MCMARCPFQGALQIVLTDITGTEDHDGDMDFKIAGTKGGITALQLDVKLENGVPVQNLIEALEVGRVGRDHILEEMAKGMDSSKRLVPRNGVKSTAPRVDIARFHPDRKEDLIGPGGAVLRQLEDRFGVSLDLSQDGQCLIYGEGGGEDNGHSENRGARAARNAISELVGDVELGGVYEAVVLEVKDFGAIVEVMRNKSGILHISEITDDESLLSSPNGNKGAVENLLAVGQKIDLLRIGVDPIRGHYKLSRKMLLRRQRQGGMDVLTMVDGVSGFGKKGTAAVSGELSRIIDEAGGKNAVEVSEKWVYDDEELSRSRTINLDLTMERQALSEERERAEWSERWGW